MLQDANLHHLTLLAGNHGTYQVKDDNWIHTCTHSYRKHGHHALHSSESLHATTRTLSPDGAPDPTQFEHHTRIYLTWPTTLDPSAPTTHELNVSATTSSEKTVKLLQARSNTLCISPKIPILLVQPRAFHAIFLTLRTMLRNEITRAEAINLSAVNYWQQHTIPAPPPHPRSAEFDSTLPRATSLLQHLQRALPSDTSSDSDSEAEANDNTSPMYSPALPQ